MPGGLDQDMKTWEKVHARCVSAGQTLRKSVFLRHWWRELAVVGALLLTIAAPFLLKPAQSSAPSRYDRRLVVITPHHEKIRQEFGQAFARKWKERTGETLYIDWRVAGSGDIALMLRSDFAGAFEYYWTHILTKTWSQRVAGAFGNSKVDLSAPSTEANDVEQEARRAFLESDVSVGVDVFFGGGAFDFESQTKAGFLVSSDASKKHGLDAIFARHPDWFVPEVLPQNVNGESFYDKDHRWVGACLSTMGMVYNRDVIKRLGLEKEPAQWADLADPKYRGQIALADPNKSGTVTKSLDQLVQQQMQIAIDEIRQKPGGLMKEKDIVNAGIRIGWTRGLQLIQRISANARYFTDNATKIPLEVSQGDAAAGMCIDFYGYSFEEMVRKPDGSARVGFAIPVGGTGVSVDPIGMLRGAPEPEVATAFMEFVLSEEGQRLWNYAPGSPGGPQHHALRRLPARKDFYTEQNRPRMTDSQAEPYEDAKAFTYYPERTGQLFNVLRFLLKSMCVENHDEQREAWEMITRANLPQRSTEIFSDVSLVNYDAAMELAAMLAKKNKTQELRKARELTMHFRAQYRRARDLATGGQ